MKLLPTDIEEFQYIGRIRDCIDLYLIDDTYEDTKYNGIVMSMSVGQLALRKYLNINYRIKENPWCVVQNETNPASFNYGKLTMTAIWSWSYYSCIPKVAAFYNNKLIALKHSAKHNKDFVWWDRKNFPYSGIPISIDGEEVEVDDLTGRIIGYARR